MPDQPMPRGGPLIQHDPNFDPKNYKRCRACRILHPLRDFATKRDKWCYYCRGLQPNPDGTVSVLPRIEAPPEPRKPRANAAKYPLDSYAGYTRYIREKAQERRNAERKAAGLAPIRNYGYGLKCRHCRMFKPRSAYQPRTRICIECLDKEAQAIEAYYRSMPKQNRPGRRPAWLSSKDKTE